ncbi:MAG: phage holin family protein, partial [Burkholderiales bacterium]
NSGPHLVAGAMGIVKNMFGLLLNRIELAALELSEVRAILLKLALIFALGTIAAWFAVGYWSALLVYLTWDVLGWKILLIVAAGFTAIAIGILYYARAVVAEGKLSMPATMNELRNDRDALL